MTKFLPTVFILLISLLLISCSDSDTSTDTSDSSSTTTITTENGPMEIRFSSTTAEAGESISLTYSLDDGRSKNSISKSKAIAGTIHWDDGTDDRLGAQGGTISHTYTQAGTYNIHIQPDGGTKVPIGTVVISEATTVAVTTCPTTLTTSEKTGSTTAAATYTVYRVELVSGCYALVESTESTFALNSSLANAEYLTIVIGNEASVGFGTLAGAFKEVKTGAGAGSVNTVAQSPHPACTAGSASNSLKSTDNLSTWSYSATSSCNSGAATGTVPAITLTKM